MTGTIIKDCQLKNNWAPRIGATYDLTGDGKTKLYGNYGIFYARIPIDLAARALSADDGFTRGDYFDANLTRPIPNGVATQTPAQAASGTRRLALHPGGRRRGHDRSERQAVVHERSSCSASSARSCRRRRSACGTCTATCRACSKTWRTARWRPTTWRRRSAVCGSVDYILTNPSSATPINAAAIAPIPAFGAVKFDDPVHNYDALEVTLNRRGSNWSAMASYRYSRLRGNFEGFYRDDNGQSDPGISSLYDFPTNDPTYTSIGVAQFGYPGDIRFLGDANGILPLDRPHQFKLNGNYMFAKNLNLGVEPQPRVAASR